MKSYTKSVPIVLLAVFFTISSGARWNRWRKKQTPSPTYAETTTTTEYPTPFPTPFPTPQPTPFPTANPTEQPTGYPTLSPLTDSCEFSRCAEIALIVDNTGGLSDGCCETQLDNIGELLSSFKENNKRDNPKVAYIEVNGVGADIVVPLQSSLNNDVRDYVNYLRTRECGPDEGATNLDQGMLVALDELIPDKDYVSECIQKIVIVMNCDTEDRQVICDNAPNVLQKHGIEVVQINALGADCGIHKPNDYLNCLGNDICVVDDLRDDSSWRECIDEQQDIICADPTTTTPQPTPWPTPVPTPWPTYFPTPLPTYNPTDSPTQHHNKRWGKKHSQTTTGAAYPETTTTESPETTRLWTTAYSTEATTEYPETTTTTEKRHHNNGRNNGYVNEDTDHDNQRNNGGNNGSNNGGDSNNNNNNNGFRHWRR